MSRPVYLVFVTGPPAATPSYLNAVADANPESVLLVVAHQAPHRGEWIEIRTGQSVRTILAACRAAIRDSELRGVAIHATKGGAEWSLRLAALRLAGRELRIYNDNLDHFPFRNTGVLWQHLKWRWTQRPRGILWWKFLAGLAIFSPRFAMWSRRFRLPSLPKSARPASIPSPGISVVIPTRDGRDLLASMLPSVVADLTTRTAEIIIVDNGSSDGTAAFLREHYPAIHIESSESPLSFSAAVNRGIQAARYSHVVLLNNDMQIEPNFFAALRTAFDRVPTLFCATAQIFFPEGRRREETGLCFWSPDPGDDFPVYCAEPKEGEDGTLVLYGSGGCSMYDTAKLRALGGFDEIYQPAYVEDLDIGYRGWQNGWPTVFCAGAKVEHRHRATTSRYYQPEYLDYLVERNYLRFLVRASGDIFPELWREALMRLQRRAANKDKAARRALRSAWKEALKRIAHPNQIDERALKQALTK